MEKIDKNKMIDIVESNIKKMVTAQERAQLLRQKVTELQELFMDETVSIETLRTLEFKYKTTKAKKTDKKDAVKEVVEEINSDLNIEDADE